MPMLRNTLLIIQAIKTDKGWDLISVPEMYGFIARLIFMGFVLLLRQEYYWSSASLHNGNWARRMISSRDRFRSWHFLDAMIIQLWIMMTNSDKLGT